MSLAIATVAGVVVTVAVTRLVEVSARRRDVVDTPSERSSHVVPTPRLGGIGIMAGVAATLLLSGGLSDSRIVIIVLGSTTLGLIGLIDDLRHIPVAVKLGGQVLPATIVVLLLSPLLSVNLPGTDAVLLPYWLSSILAIFWIVTVCNVINFMDGIDGLAASCAAIGAMAIGVAGGTPVSAFVAVAAASLGFLVWNWPRASIFMGDSGSQFLGFMLGAGAIAAEPNNVVAYGPVLVAPLLFDVALTLVRRMARGRNIFAAHREHLYQRLAAAWGHGRVALTYAGATLICAVAAVLYATSDPFLGYVALGLVAVTFVALGVLDERLALTGP